MLITAHNKDIKNTILDFIKSIMNFIIKTHNQLFQFFSYLAEKPET